MYRRLSELCRTPKIGFVAAALPLTRPVCLGIVMLARKELLPQVIELNFQAGQLYGCNAYLVFDADAWALIDIGYEETVDELLEVVRQCDFPFAQCAALIATHADVDHVQGLARLRSVLKKPTLAHPLSAKILRAGDPYASLAKIPAIDLDLDMPAVEIDREIGEGDVIEVGSLKLDVWHTPGHTPGSVSLRLKDVLFCGDLIYRDGCVGAIDAQHGSDIEAFVVSLRRILDSDVKWLAPSHGPCFAKNDDQLREVIARVESYRNRADFGACAKEWPLMDEWEREIVDGIGPT
jgi:hydroxyacylglutathione hydrolase